MYFIFLEHHHLLSSSSLSSLLYISSHPVSNLLTPSNIPANLLTPLLLLCTLRLPAASTLSDEAYIQAAAIFQRLRTDKPITQRLLHYGKRTDTPLPESRDRTTQKQAYQLAFNTLKCIAVCPCVFEMTCNIVF